MALAANLQTGQSSEWALLRRHPSEGVFGIQVACGHTDQMAKIARLLENETSSDFIDLNCGCPIDAVCNKLCGSALLTKPNRLLEIVKTMTHTLTTRSITVKVRTGIDEKAPTTHKLIPQLQKVANNRLSAIMVSIRFHECTLAHVTYINRSTVEAKTKDTVDWRIGNMCCKLLSLKIPPCREFRSLETEIFYLGKIGKVIVA